MSMKEKFIPKIENLKNINWRKPKIDKSNKKELLLLVLGIALFVVVFVPWYCIGIECENVGAIKLRAFGFHTWYGIVAGLVALLSIGGVLYKQLAVTFWSSVVGLAIGLYAVNDYPTMRVSASLNEDLEPAAKIRAKIDKLEAPEYPDYGDYPDYDDYCEARDHYYSARESYERKYYKLVSELDEYPHFEEKEPFIYIAKYIEDMPTLKIPGEFIEAAMVFYDFYDQDFFEAFFEKTGVDKAMKTFKRKVKTVYGDYDFIYHRLGSILCIVFSILALVLSYVVINGGWCNKKACATDEIKLE